MEREHARFGNDNLEPISEELDEDYDNRSSKRSETEDGKGERQDRMRTSVNRGENNKFNVLCDGVLNALALVHEAVQDLLEFKDELLKQMLPPTLLIQLALISGKVFRSISDLGIPVGELVRLVRVYSTTWDENSIALSKLHENCESKRRQLNIAIKRLQLLDQHSKEVARDKRVMNWEKLFSKVMSAKGHGRQWKFHIETVKQKAKLGLEHLEAYARSLDESSESESFCSDEDDVVKEDQVFKNTNDNEEEEKETVTVDDKKDSKDGQTEDFPGMPAHVEPVEDIDSMGKNDQSSLEIQRSGKVQSDDIVVPPHVVKSLMRDAQTWTHDPEFDCSLFIRIFCPEGFRKSGLKCSLSYSGNMFKTPILDDSDNEILDDELLPVRKERLDERPHASPKPEDRSNINESHSKSGSNSGRQKRFFEFEIKMPDETGGGALQESEKLHEPETVRIAVHQGKYEEILAVTSLDMKDIKKMNLETVYLPYPHGDDDVPVRSSRTNSASSVSSFDDESLSGSVDIPVMAVDHPKQMSTTASHEVLIKTSKIQLFPLYSLHSGKSDTVRMPCGNVPLLLYWGKCAQPLYFNRQCGTRSVFDLVYEMTGIDLTTTTKEDLQKEMMDEALSVVTFTPKPEEETVLKSDYEKMVKHHHQELCSVQEEYEKRLQELQDSLLILETKNPKNPQSMTHHSHAAPAVSQHSSAPGTITPVHKWSENLGPSQYGKSLHSPVAQQGSQPVSSEKVKTDSVKASASPVKHRSLPSRTQKSNKNFRTDRNLPRWGENLPQDFFERLHLWEEESKQHKQILNERTLKDIKDSLEKKLAGQHKLSKREEEMYDAVKDVSLPALFMPFKLGNVYNPRAHQYFHPTGCTEVRLTQPPSIFHLPPLPKAKLSVMNLFEMSKNFHVQGPAWLAEQGQLVEEDFPQTSAPTSALPQTIASEQTSFTENMDLQQNMSVGSKVES